MRNNRHAGASKSQCLPRETCIFLTLFPVKIIWLFTLDGLVNNVSKRNNLTHNLGSSQRRLLWQKSRTHLTAKQKHITRFRRFNTH